MYLDDGKIYDLLSKLSYQAETKFEEINMFDPGYFPTDGSLPVLKDEIVQCAENLYYGYFDQDTGLQHGYGIEVKDGSIYEGFFANGKRDGNG